MTLIEKGGIETCSLLVRWFYWELEVNLDAYIEADSLASTYVYVGLRRFSNKSTNRWVLFGIYLFHGVPLMIV